MPVGRKPHSMSIRTTSLLMLVVFCTFQTTAHGDAVDDVCGAAEYAADKLCSMSINLPSKAAVTYKKACTNKCCDWDCGQKKCTANWCKWDCGQKKCTNKCCKWNCGQKKCTNNCCTWTKRVCGFLGCANVPQFGCSKSKCGETCVNIPCTGCSARHCGETCVNIPCSGFSSSKCGQTCVNIPCTGCSKSQCGEACTNVPTGLEISYSKVSPCSVVPGAQQLVSKAVAICPCLKSVKDAVKEIGDGSSLTASALAAAADLASCVVKLGFKVQDSKDDVVADLLDDDDFIIMGPVIDMSVYTEMLAAVTACVFGGCELILDVLQNYFEDLVASMGDGFNKFLKELLINAIAKPVKDRIEETTKAIKALPTNFVNKVKKCSKDLGTAGDKIVEAVKDSLEDVKAFPREVEQFIDALDTVITKGTKAVERIDAVMEASEGPAAIVTQLAEGSAPLLESVDFIVNLDEVQDTIKAVKTVKDELDGIKARIKSVDDNVEIIRETASELPASCRPAGFTKFDDLSRILSNVDITVGTIKDVLKSVDFGPNMIQAGVTTYKQWATLSADLPCTRQKTKTFTDLGFTKVSASYPEIYSCKWAKKIAFPNEHIPYVRIKMNKNVVGSGITIPVASPTPSPRTQGSTAVPTSFPRGGSTTSTSRPTPLARATNCFEHVGKLCRNNNQKQGVYREGCSDCSRDQCKLQCDEDPACKGFEYTVRTRKDGVVCELHSTSIDYAEDSTNDWCYRKIQDKAGNCKGLECFQHLGKFCRNNSVKFGIFEAACTQSNPCTKSECIKKCLGDSKCNGVEFTERTRDDGVICELHTSSIDHATDDNTDWCYRKLDSCNL